jgi:hypothetical protein
VTPLVEHVTTVTAEGAAAGAVAAALAARGFAVGGGGGPRVVAVSREVEPAEVRRLLRAAGVEDASYRVVLEFGRGWGFL